MRQITSDNIVHMEKRATNKLGLILVVIAVIAIFGGGGFFLYKNKDSIDWELKLPWESKERIKSEKKKEEIKKKSQKELIVPTSIEEGSLFEEDCVFSIVGVKADDKGYLFDVEFITKHEWANFNVETILIDSFYTSAHLSMNDRADIGEQISAKSQFRITKTELDSMNIYGFYTINLFYTIETPYGTSKPLRGSIKFNNEIAFSNGREGLLRVDEKGGCLLEYYKTVKANDATYIYFDVYNSDIANYKKLYIRKLMINGRIYEMPEFEVKAYRTARSSFYIKIPVEKIKDVENFLVSFFIVSETSDGELYEVNITNEYSKKL